MTTQDKIEELLVPLEQAIRGNRRFFVTAKADPQFHHVRDYVDGLLLRLIDEARGQAQDKLKLAQSDMKEAESWHAYETAPNEYNTASYGLSKATESFITGSYFGYLDTVPLALEAANKAQAATHAQKASMRTIIEELTTKINSLQSDIKILLDWFNERPNKEAELEVAQQSLKEAHKLLAVGNYDSYYEATKSLQRRLEDLQSLSTSLQRERRIAEANSEYPRKLAQAKADRNYKLLRLHLALLCWIGSAFSGSFVLVILLGDSNKWHKWLSDDGPPFALLGIAVSAVLLAIGDRLWSIGNNEPGEEFQWYFLWLALLSLATGAVCLIIGIIAYIRGLKVIPHEYREGIELEENRHRAAFKE